MQKVGETVQGAIPCHMAGMARMAGMPGMSGMTGMTGMTGNQSLLLHVFGSMLQING